MGNSQGVWSKSCRRVVPFKEYCIQSERVLGGWVCALAEYDPAKRTYVERIEAAYKFASNVSGCLSVVPFLFWVDDAQIHYGAQDVLFLIDGKPPLAVTLL